MRLAKLVNLTLVVSLIATAGMACQFLPFDYGFALTVENRMSQPIRMFRILEDYQIPGLKIEGCSRYFFGSEPFRPNQAVKIEMRDLEGRTIIAVQQVPTWDEATKEYRLTVVVPATQEGVCPEIAVVPTPTRESSESLKTWQAR